MAADLLKKEQNENTAIKEPEENTAIQEPDGSPAVHETAEEEASPEKSTEKEEKETRKSRRKRKRKYKIRRFPILLRVIVVLILAAACVALGLMVGYGVIGDGNPTDALEKQTWQHILDIIQKE